MSSIVSVSPSFNSHSFNNLVDIADRVVQELCTENRFDDDDFFDFIDDENQSYIGAGNDNGNGNTRTEKVEENDPENDDEQEFEFPVVCAESNSSPNSVDHDVSSESTQILPTYPLFDRSLLLDVYPDFSTGVDCSETDSKPSPPARLSLRKLFIEERDSASSSSSEADDLDRISPGTYCVWKPKTESRGNHKKSYSIDNTSKRWKVRDLLKRSYSDDNYSTGKETAAVLFSPPIATNQKINNEKVKKIEKTAKVASSAVGDSSASTRTENQRPPSPKSKAGGNRLPPYLPYRPDQVGVFGHFNGSSRNLYRY